MTELKKEDVLKPGTPVKLNKAWQLGDLKVGDEGIVIGEGMVSGDWRVVFKDKGIHVFRHWFFDVDSKYLPERTKTVKAHEVEMGNTIKDEWGDKIVVDFVALVDFNRGDSVTGSTQFSFRGYDDKHGRGSLVAFRNSDVVVYL